MTTIQKVPPKKQPRKRTLKPGLYVVGKRWDVYETAFGTDRTALLRAGPFGKLELAQVIRTMTPDKCEKFFVALENGDGTTAQRLFDVQSVENGKFAPSLAMSVFKQYEHLDALDSREAKKVIILMKAHHAKKRLRHKKDWTLYGFRVDENLDPILPMQAAREPKDDVLALAQELGLDLKQTCLLSLHLKGGPAFNRYGHATYLTGNGKSQLLAALDEYGNPPISKFHIVDDGPDEMADEMSDDPAHFDGGNGDEGYDNHGFYFVGPDESEGLAA